MQSKPMRSREDVMAAMEAVAEKDSSYAAGSVFILSSILDVLFDLREQNERLIRQNDTIIKRLEEMPSKPRINPPF